MGREFCGIRWTVVKRISVRCNRVVAAFLLLYEHSHMRSCVALKGLIGFIFCLFGCDIFMPVNAHPSASIQEMGAHKAGADGFVVYAVLADP